MALIFHVHTQMLTQHKTGSITLYYDWFFRVLKYIYM